MARSVQNGTLTSNSVATVTVTDGYPMITVINRSQTGTIWARLDGTDPTVAGANCYPVLGASTFMVTAPHATNPVVKLIANAALDYSVVGDPGGT